jgi:hypothetical protein
MLLFTLPRGLRYVSALTLPYRLLRLQSNIAGNNQAALVHLEMFILVSRAEQNLETLALAPFVALTDSSIASYS